MAYLIIKKIKGISYVYEQTTYRVGEKVYTRSRYLGRAQMAEESWSPEGSNPSAKVARAVTPRRQRPIAKNTTKMRPLEKVTTTNFVIKPDLKKHKISANALQKEHDTALSQLKKSGLDITRFPHISVKHGLYTTHKRRFRNGAYVVTLPRKSCGARTRFKNHFSQTIAHASLDLLAQQRPTAYAELAFEFDRSFRETQKALTAYMVAASPEGFVKGLALKYWGIIRKSKQTLPQPEKVGLLDFSKRKSWRDELVTIMTHIQRKGLRKVREQIRHELTVARREFSTAMTERKKTNFLSTRWWRTRKRWRKALAREQAQLALQRKLECIERIFYSDRQEIG